MSDSGHPTSSALPSATPTVHDEPGISSPADISGIQPGSDVEKSRNEKAAKATQDNDSRSTDDGVLVVDWEGPDDPQNPKKCVIPSLYLIATEPHQLWAQPPMFFFSYSWSLKKKWAATLIVSAFTFISPVSSSMMAPASEQIAREFGITSSSVIALLTSVFVAAYGESCP